MTEPGAGLAGFWPFYLGEHQNRTNQILHAVGSLAAIGWLAAAILLASPWFVLAALVNGYAFAWVGHIVFERNRPATFKYPIRSFLSDWRLLVHVLSGHAFRHSK